MIAETCASLVALLANLETGVIPGETIVASTVRKIEQTTNARMLDLINAVI